MHFDAIFQKCYKQDRKAYYSRLLDIPVRLKEHIKVYEEKTLLFLQYVGRKPNKGCIYVRQWWW